jgi:hypothetical protein
MDLMTNVRRCKYHHCCKYAGFLLLRRLERFIRQLKNDNPGLRKVFTLIATSGGERLANRYGFKQVTEYQSPFGWKLFEMDLTNA